MSALPKVNFAICCGHCVIEEKSEDCTCDSKCKLCVLDDRRCTCGILCKKCMLDKNEDCCGECPSWTIGICSNDKCGTFLCDNHLNDLSNLPARIRKEKNICQFYKKKGWCAYGDTCKYKHQKNQQVCLFFAQGDCRNGDDCSFLHIKRDPPKCRHFQKAGHCNLGDKCKFLHER